MAVVIQARIRGLQAGFTELDALARHDRDAGRETPSMPVCGIDGRPAEQAFVNHFTGCTFCYPRSGSIARKAGASPAGDDGNPAIVGHVEHYARARFAGCGMYQSGLS